MKTKELKSESEGIQCWGQNPQAQMLRVELRDGSFLLFPYALLERVHFTPSEQADTLELVFGGHSVGIAGHNLRDIGAALQRTSVEWLKEQPERYKPVASANAVFIQSICVKEPQGEEN